MRLHLLVVPEPSTIKPGMELPVDESPGGLVWKTQQPLVVEDWRWRSRFPQLTPLLLENGVQSFCVVPLTTALRRLGAMGFGSLQQDESTRKQNSVSCSRWPSRSRSPWTTCCTTRAPRPPSGN